MAVSASRQAERTHGPAAEGLMAGLRAAVARIEGRPVHRLADASVPDGGRRSPLLPLGLAGADAALGGGMPRAGLVEIHGQETQGIGAATGFVLALAVLFAASPRRPLLWIGTDFFYREAGRLYGPGLAASGLSMDALLSVGTRRLAEAVWAAEEAARSGLPALAVLEARGNPSLLGLEGTRRLHLRARAAGVPFVLLRQAGRAEATAAPWRLRIAAGRSGAVPDLADVKKLVGRPVFALDVEKTPGRRSEQVLVQWNAHDRRFEAPDRDPGADPRLVFPPAVDGPDPAHGTRRVLALRSA